MFMKAFMQEGGVWGVVIIISAFMIQVFAFGTTASIGVYNIELLDYFNQATVGVSLIGSINFGVFLGSGPIVSFLMSKISYRKIALFGSLLITVGLIGMPLLPYIPAMCLSFGILAGFGSSCVYIPSHVLSGVYYDKYRSLATGLATSGSGLGGAIMPVIVGKLIEIYSWKGSFIVLAGLCAHLFIFSALLLMPQNTKVKNTLKEKVSDPEGCSEQATPLVKEANGVPDGKNKNSYETEAKTMASHDFGDGVNVIKRRKSEEETNQKLSQKTRANSVNVDHHCMSLQDGGRPSVLNSDKEDVRTPWGSAPVHTYGICQPLTQSSSSLHAAGSRGSGYLGIKNVHQNQNGDVAERQPLSVRKESAEPAESTKPKKPNASKHIYIFTNYGFNVFFISNIAWNAACSIITSFAAEYLREEGLTPMEAAWMVGSFGFGTFLGGLVGGVLGNFKFVNRQILYTSANFIMGALLILFPYLNHMALYATALTVSGVFFGVILGLLVVVLTDLIGIESLGNGLGYLMLSNGLGTFIGPPLAGLLRGPTGGFAAGIIFAGVLCIFGGLTMGLMLCPCRDRQVKGEKFSDMELEVKS